MNLRRIMACARTPNYHRFAEKYSPQEYARRVIWGDIEDPVMQFQMHEGFHWCGVIAGYLPSDLESRGNATIIVWLNERYRPDLPTLIPEGVVL